MLKLGMCITGSFCSMDDMLYVLKLLNDQYDVEVFLTPNVANMDTRFYSSTELKNKIEEITHKKCNTTLQEAEVYGPIKHLDIVLIYPCDANTLNKLNSGVNDNAVTMLVKSSLRNHVPIVLGVFSNDVLSYSGGHLFNLINKKNYFLVPMYQDDYKKKPYSMIACKNKVLLTLKEALVNKQLQPIILGYKEV